MPQKKQPPKPPCGSPGDGPVDFKLLGSLTTIPLGGVTLGKGTFTTAGGASGTFETSGFGFGFELGVSSMRGSAPNLGTFTSFSDNINVSIGPFVFSGSRSESNGNFYGSRGGGISPAPVGGVIHIDLYKHYIHHLLKVILVISPISISFGLPTRAQHSISLLDSIGETLVDSGYEVVRKDTNATYLRSPFLAAFTGGSWSKFVAFDRIKLSDDGSGIRIKLTSLRVLFLFMLVSSGWGFAFFWQYDLTQRLLYGVLTGMLFYVVLVAECGIRTYFWLSALARTEEVTPTSHEQDHS